MKSYDAIVVGGGISGLTATAFLNKQGYNTLLCEQSDKVGGLVSTFTYKGFTFDGGIRAIENSGIVLPMLKSLGLEVEFLDSTVSLGIEDTVIQVQDRSAVLAYGEVLKSKFPNNKDDIDTIIAQIDKIMDYMRILYGIDNPIFLDPIKDGKYFVTKVIPWMFDYLFTFRKVQKLSIPVEDYLRTLTNNQALNDVIAQHFFKQTPAFFALSYFSLYLDYRYPKGGTGTLVHTIEDYINETGGTIQTNTKITSIDPVKKIVTDESGEQYSYKSLIWSANLTTFYDVVDISHLPRIKQKQKVLDKKQSLQGLRGGDSVATTYFSVDLPPEYYDDKCTAHFFYTPKLDGLYDIFQEEEKVLLSNDKETIKDWVIRHYENTTYEISIPVLRDPDMAPEGKSGLIVSTLFSYDITKKIQDMGWYNEFKTVMEDITIQVLSNTIFPGLQDQIIDRFSSTPLTLQSRTGNIDGAITGWAFTNSHMPAVDELIKIAQSVKTPFKDIFQSGQWTYSPAGLPIAILTGKLASNQAIKRIKKAR
ncbi:phytoene desaturase family protein [Candidatus Xianfuyuplasma coldseepsis]|uniref:NAD(P)/FAD-dependent oxidoreductase n=1 Tax=Candidatus Xianfuyuplasma coldseepsis TaxID=2782163 RepID=A0A7L7KQX7_9MOLU|nr:NAD(P)/FAD-dependent oxidoreductase [Xianfuyuplasma coldseepsis]QMS85221.1 NAD(P)/FAD-dependent oxidoreductase [Xianfuyuplasma coldseepsis]